MPRFLLGINYWPRCSAMEMWRHFDAGEIDDDFARIAALGLDVVRFFLLWEAFQPEPGAIDREALRKLDIVAGLLQSHGLRAMPTFFTGHMSGVNWLPEWALDQACESGRFRTYNALGERPYGIGDFYTDTRLVEAQQLQVRTVGERFRGYPAILAWDLGNEFSNLRLPRNPQEGADWGKRLTDDLLETSGIGVTAGTHGEDVDKDNHLRLSSMCSGFQFATMHGYTVYSDFARDRLDQEVVPFLSALAGALSKRPVLFSEFGNPTCSEHSAFACLTEAEMCTYAYGVLDRLQRRGALGAFWWCWADYADAIAHGPPFDRAKHELSFGIVRSDGSLKPVADTLAGFAREAREVVAAPAFTVDEDAYYAALPEAIASEYAAYLSSEAIRSS